MPAVGDQHKPNGNTTANPFEEQPKRITEYTAQEIATLQSRLDKQLGPEYISSRAGPGGAKVHYLAADKAISLANAVFGFNGWSSSIQNIQIDFVDEHPQTGKVSLGLSVIVRVTLKDGTHHEDIGYGQIENCKGKAAAFEKAKKEGTTDALKRALRNFGNVLGNCVYDKNYLSKVTKVKVGATKWSENSLYRHPDFAPKTQPEEVKPSVAAPPKEEAPEFEDSFELADFDEEDFNELGSGHPDEVALPVDSLESVRTAVNGAPGRPLPPTKMDFATPSKPPVPAVARPAPVPGSSTVVPQPLPGQRPHGVPAAVTRQTAVLPPPDVIARASSPHFHAPHGGPQESGASNSAAVGGTFSAGFYSAKAAEKIDDNNNAIGPVPRFNPHADSPSIRKTSGINHNKSIPLKRDLTHDTTPLPTNIINPQSDQARRLGAPGASGQFSSVRGPSTSAYRPPTRRGPEPGATAETGVLQAAKRTPLGDVSNGQHQVTTVTNDGADAKRQRVAESGQGGTEGVGNNNNKSGG